MYYDAVRERLLIPTGGNDVRAMRVEFATPFPGRSPRFDASSGPDRPIGLGTPPAARWSLEVPMLTKTWIKDANGKIVGSETSGFNLGRDTVVHGADGEYLGRTSQQFDTKRDSSGKVAAKNAADTGLLLGRK
jgi:hypothetical protein